MARSRSTRFVLRPPGRSDEGRWESCDGIWTREVRELRQFIIQEAPQRHRGTPELIEDVGPYGLEAMRKYRLVTSRQGRALGIM